MFGESESESPRVPSPWDTLISTPPSPSTSPSPLSLELLPRLVPENDDGNVEYKLQLLSPSPARFARLVTQLKWRLLEGGGQAYYELGVADSGALVGLPRAELEESLETLEMMAGEIGASVIVVKEIEVPAAMAGLAASQTSMWNGERKRRADRPGYENGDCSSTSVLDTSTDDLDEEDYAGMSSTVVQDKPTRASSPVFAMDLEFATDDVDSAQQPYIAIDLEIASVFKPRPMRARMQFHPHAHYVGPTKTKRLKKIKHITHPDAMDDDAANTTVKHQRQHTNQSHPHNHRNNHIHNHHSREPEAKTNTRRQNRDRKREEKRRALIAYATAATATNASTISPSPSPGPIPLILDEEETHTPSAEETSALVSGLAALHVSQVDSELELEVEPKSSELIVASPVEDSDPQSFLSGPVEDDEDDGDADDVFAPPPASADRSARDADPHDQSNTGHRHSRLIVEALVVRKMSLDEGFLDFGGFALI